MALLSIHNNGAFNGHPENTECLRQNASTERAGF